MPILEQEANYHYVYVEYHLLGYNPCSPLRVNRRFGGIYRLHLQDRKNKQHETKLSACFDAAFLISLFFQPRRYIPPKRRQTLNGLYGVISQNTELFKTGIESYFNISMNYE
jgi:hypothetical protein